MDPRSWIALVLVGTSTVVASAPAVAQSSAGEVRVIDGRVCRRDDSRPQLRSGPRWVCEDQRPEEPRERVRVRGRRR